LIAEVTVDADWKVTIKTHIDIAKPLHSNIANQTDIFVAVEEAGWIDDSDDLKDTAPNEVLNQRRSHE
jgi:hypothetical protein